ncbi:MAG: glycosyltransferase family 2 protein [Elusimicrobia bacterium]|nr:glycosyltransferase family 2 protein [Elusimicrobiota bacterium]
MPTISFAIIAHNEASILTECLETVKWADEIVFVDCQSTDNSISIAQNYNAKVFERKNEKTVYINKQFALDRANSDWVFILDPDERIDESLKNEILKKISSPNNINGYSLPRKNFYFGKWLRHGGKYPDFQLRLIRKDKGKFTPLPVHEKIIIEGKTAFLKNDLIHYPYKNTEDIIKKFEFYSDIISQKYILANYSKTYVFIRPFSKFLNSYILKLGFIDGAKGLMVALMDFCVLFITAIRFKEKIENKNND